MISNRPTATESPGLRRLLYTSFLELSPAWLPSEDDALEAVHESFGDNRLSRVGLLGDEVVGWVAGNRLYGRVWELHPMVVAANRRRQGFGRQLVEDFERQVAVRGALTLHLSTSDESDRTTLFGVDLYQEPLEHLRRLRSTREHPIDFYLRVGFSLVGVLPDAEGPGMPSILFAKSVAIAGSGGN